MFADSVCRIVIDWGYTLQLQDNILAMKAPPPLQELDLSSTHTILGTSPSSERLAGPQPLMYNESVRLAVRPTQQNFIEQGQDMFYLKQLDVVRNFCCHLLSHAQLCHRSLCHDE